MPAQDPLRPRRGGERLLRCDVTPERDLVRVRPVGALDLFTAPVLRAKVDELRAAGFKRVLLDLSELEFMDSSGVHLTLELDAEARSDGFTFALVPGPEPVQRVFALTETIERLPFTER
jgi:anti-sigma B factor antagonist